MRNKSLHRRCSNVRLIDDKKSEIYTVVNGLKRGGVELGKLITIPMCSQHRDIRISLPLDGFQRYSI